MMFLILLVAGVFIGLLTGLFGIGGAVLMIPLVSTLLIMKHTAEFSAIHLAVGTSLMTTAMTMMPAIWQHHKLGNIHWDIFLKALLPSGILGAVLGALLAGFLPSEALKFCFSSFVLIIGLFMIYKSIKVDEITQKDNKKSYVPYMLSASIISIVSGLVGVGGVSIMTSYLAKSSSIHKAIGTSSMYGFPVVLTAAMVYLLQGIHQQGLPFGATGFVYWPAVLALGISALIFSPLGAKLGANLSQKALKRSFGSLLVISSFVALI